MITRLTVRSPSVQEVTVLADGSSSKNPPGAWYRLSPIHCPVLQGDTAHRAQLRPPS